MAGGAGGAAAPAGRALSATGRARARRRAPCEARDWQRQALHVLAVTVVHDVEELLAVRAALARPPAAAVLARWGVAPDRAWSAFRLLNWSVSGAAAVSVGVGVRHHRPALPAVAAAALLANVVLPHVPAAVRARGYAPGVVTSVGLVLPVTSRFLLQVRREGLLTRAELARCLQAGLALVVLGLPVGLLAADRAVLAAAAGRRSLRPGPADRPPPRRCERGS